MFSCILVENNLIISTKSMKEYQYVAKKNDKHIQMGLVKNNSRIYLSKGEWKIIFYYGTYVIKIYEVTMTK
jgi:hypothetical protein